MLSRLRVLAIAGIAAAGVIGVVGAQAKPIPAASGTVTLTSEVGDVFGQGRTYEFTPPDIDLGLSDSVTVTVEARGGETWRVLLAAPDGELLEEGRYSGAGDRWSTTRPYLDLDVSGRSCSEVFGSLTVHDVEYEVHDYLESLHLSFVARCEATSGPALRGEIDVATGPPPAPLEVRIMFETQDVALDPETGRLELHGSITCSEETPAVVEADIREVGHDDYADGTGEVDVPSCSSTPTEWLVAAESTNGVPFTGGAIDGVVRGQATDVWYSDYHGRPTLSTFETSTRLEVPDPPAQAAGGLLGVIARHPLSSVAVGIGTILAAALATALVTLLAARRRLRRPDSGESAAP